MKKKKLIMRICSAICIFQVILNTAVFVLFASGYQELSTYSLNFPEYIEPKELNSFEAEQYSIELSNLHLTYGLGLAVYFKYEDCINIDENNDRRPFTIYDLNGKVEPNTALLEYKYGNRNENTVYYFGAVYTDTPYKAKKMQADKRRGVFIVETSNTFTIREVLQRLNNSQDNAQEILKASTNLLKQSYSKRKRRHPKYHIIPFEEKIYFEH